MPRRIFTLLLIAAATASCKPKTEDNREEMARRASVRDAVAVSTVELKRTTFYHELVTNGKVFAGESANVPFLVSGTIKSIRVKNGDYVKRGDLLAEIDDEKYRLDYDRAAQQVEKAGIDFKDDLLSFHGSLDTAGLSAEMLRMSRIRSGLVAAMTNLKEAEYNLQHTKLYAPISGLVANMEAHEWNPVSIYSEGLCSIIDNSTMEVRFPLLESEYGFVEKGMEVNVIPYAGSDEKVGGHITQINPRVDEHGMITVTAEMENGRKLIDGMNVKVLLRKALPGQLVVPKEALVIRQDRDVVFVREDSLAIWRYVTTGFENSSSFTITEGLSEGDLVIVKGNINLAHETVVKEEKR